MRAVAWMVVASAFLAGVARAEDDARKEREKLEGTWQVTSAKDNGQKMPADQVKDIRLVFSGEEFSTADGDLTIMKGTFTVHPSKKPKAMDLKSLFGRHKNETAPAVYKLDGDTLTICLAAPKDKRPAKLESTVDNGAMLMVCKREKQ